MYSLYISDAQKVHSFMSVKCRQVVSVRLSRMGRCLPTGLTLVSKNIQRRNLAEAETIINCCWLQFCPDCHFVFCLYFFYNHDVHDWSLIGMRVYDCGQSFPLPARRSLFGRWGEACLAGTCLDTAEISTSPVSRCTSRPPPPKHSLLLGC